MITPDARHLGDLINIVQRHYDRDYIYSDTICPCCQQNVKQVLQFIVGMINCRLQVSDEPQPDMEVVYPSWGALDSRETLTLLWHRKPYIKAVNLPSARSSHIACQFDSRSQTPWKKQIPEQDVENLARAFGQRLVNLGDKERAGMRNLTGASLSEKFDIIASSQSYVGIDGGLTHLALMTNTKVTVLYSEMRPWLYYPDQDMSFLRSDAGLVKAIQQVSHLLA